MTTVDDNYQGMLRTSHSAVFMALIVTVLVVVGSQWGMIYLSYLYATSGRAPISITPELIFGLSAIVVAVVLTAWHENRFLTASRTWLVLLPFIAFVLACAISESLQSDLNWRAIITVATLLAYLLLGGVCGYYLGEAKIQATLVVIFLAFLGWYIGLAVLSQQGYMSFEKILVGAALPRLEVAGGFTATELPIYVGMQLPFVLMVLFSRLEGAVRIIAYCLLFTNFALLAMTASLGAIVASVLVFGLFFLFGSTAAKVKTLVLVFGAAIIIVSFGGLYLAELYVSLVYRLDDIAIGGGRARIYTSLISTAVEHPWIGIGKAKFQYTNNFAFDGTGAYPHNNLLGIAAELGIPSALMYAVFLVIFLFVVLKAAVKLRLSGYVLRSSLLVAVSAVMVYQQARGILHDTWMIKETYFWAGFGLGVAAIPRYRIVEVVGAKRSVFA